MKTQYFDPKSSGAALVTIEDKQVRTYSLDARPEWSIGRPVPDMPEPDIAFSSKIVSREHGWLRNINGSWYYVDNPGNTNGTLLNGKKIPRQSPKEKRPTPIGNGDMLRIDREDLNNAHPKGILMLFTTMSRKGVWTVYPLGEGTTVIGRDDACDIVESLPYISAKHAEIACQEGKYYLSDRDSRAGTFLNGKKVTGRVALREKDYISLCDCGYFFVDNCLLYAKRDRKSERGELLGTVPSLRPVILSASIQSKSVKVSPFSDSSEKGEVQLLKDIRIEIREGTAVAVLGTAGAGKTTLMGCLSGLDMSRMRGSVIYRGVDLCKKFKQMRYLIGNVPQEKVIRPELTPEQAFYESAQLRLSSELTKEQIRSRVEDTLELLSMTKVRDRLNSKLSGGEQTRVNLGIDLVADRDIYFLDEPDQGLSPNLKDELYVFLKKLAHERGKTIVAIIHDVNSIDMFDQVIFLVKAGGVGRLAFSGTPEAGRSYFGVPIHKAYALLEKDPEKYVRYDYAN